MEQKRYCQFLLWIKNFYLSSGLLTLVLLLGAAPFGKAQDVLLGLTSNGGIEGKGTAYSFKTDTKAFSVIKGFADWGTNPDDNLVKGTDGALYGMTGNGGIYGFGTIFKITNNGAITILKHFNLSVDGGYPYGSLVQATDGNFYGTLSNGTPTGGGAIFRITPGGQYAIIRSLNLNTDGGRPNGKLIQASDGFLYGMNYTGGSANGGTIFKINTSGTTYQVIKALTQATGVSPYGGLVQATDGALYGMTRLGGTTNDGVIFRITTDGKTYSVLRHLNDPDGIYPMGDLIQAKDGFLYGMAPNGGTYNGTIFRLKTTGGEFTVLRQLSASVEGGSPNGSLVQATDGNFYGMCYSLSGGFGGSIFKMSISAAGAATVTVMKKLTPTTDGAQPKGGLVVGSDNALYGMTYAGGKYTYGTIIRITTGNAFSVLAHLSGAALGNVPLNSLTIGKDSTYYGVAQNGGAYNHGTVFKICNGVTTVLKSFNRNVDGALPVGGLLRGRDGNLYGTTTAGGTNGGAGTIFRITPSGTFTVLRHLTSTTDGGTPSGTLVQGPDNYLYGTTSSGGANSGGTIFKITTSGTDFKVLRAFVLATDGNKPETGLVFKNNAFYGITTSGSRFFRITPDGQFTALKTFTSTTEGNSPAGSLIAGTDGALYGAMYSGGSSSRGTIFRITTDGLVTVLRHLNGSTDGGYPRGGLVQGSDGAFYGTAQSGGTTNDGVIFRVTTAKAYSVLRSFDLVKDGGKPLGGLIIAPKINLIAHAQTGLTTLEDVAKAITLSGSGASKLTFTVVTQPRNGTVTSGTGAARTYTPRANYAGKDSLAFTSNLGCFASPPAWVKFTVTPVNDAPVLAVIGNKTVVKGTPLTFTATASEVDAGQTKTFSLVGAPAGTSINATSGVFSWIPSIANSYTFKVKVADNGSPALFDEEQITVLVTNSTTGLLPPNEEPDKKDKSNKNKLKAHLFPNPVYDKLTITFKNPVSEVIGTITDAGGIILKKFSQVAETDQIEMDVSFLQPGLYQLQLQTTFDARTYRFIKK